MADTDGRDNKGRFRKGASGNPKGRPRKEKDLSEVVRDFMLDADPATGESRLKSAIKDLTDAALAGDTEAFETLLNYGYGKPEQHVVWHETVRVRVASGKRRGSSRSRHTRSTEDPASE
jgi:hypothetical protein